MDAEHPYVSDNDFHLIINDIVYHISSDSDYFCDTERSIYLCILFCGDEDGTREGRVCTWNKQIEKNRIKDKRIEH